MNLNENRRLNRNGGDTMILKFKAWDEEEKKMYDSDEIEEYEMVTGLSYGELFIAHNPGFSDEWKELLPIMFTGAYDKHNTEIYVGDIVLVRHMLVSNIPPYKAEVVWDKYRFALRNLNPRPWEVHGSLFPYNNLDTFGLDLEVLGDKYRNPELMEEGE